MNELENNLGLVADAIRSKTDSTESMSVNEMPESINSITTNEIYSTEEVVIGKWYNGKPLYSKSFSGTTAKTEADEVLATLPTECEVRDLQGMFLYNTNQSIPVNWYVNDTYRILTWYKRGSIMQSAKGEALNKPCWVTVKYTKTTD